MCTPDTVDYSDPRWLRMRAAVIERDKACSVCGATIGDKKRLVAHHMAYIRDVKQWDHPIELMICMCDRCHNKIPQRTIPVFDKKEDAIAFAIHKKTKEEQINPKLVEKETKETKETKKKGVTGHRYASLSDEESKELDELSEWTGKPSTDLLKIAFQKLMEQINIIKSCPTRLGLINTICLGETE